VVKIAVVYNWESQNVINLFGIPNRERYADDVIKGIVKALKAGGHQVAAFEGDKDLIDRLEEFMPRVVKGERPGLVFNLSYGIQGQARYTHVPSILEMVGIPYVGSGPLAHSLALDKVVAKILFKQAGLPTPDFVVLDGPGYDSPPLDYPLIAKPKNEAVSFGVKVVENEAELRAATDVIFETYQQPALVERFIAGREINVGVLGNNPPETLWPAEIIFGEGGPPIYTFEDKKGLSGRTNKVVCPAPVSEETAARAKDIALRAFKALGCFDCARVDLRLDDSGDLYLLEINSLPSIGPRGSYVIAAAAMGLDYNTLMNRLVEVAAARYFGTPEAPRIESRRREVGREVFEHVTAHRDQLEREVEKWCAVSSRTDDPVGVQMAQQRLDDKLVGLGLAPVAELSDQKTVWTWQTEAGLDGGVLLVGHLDVPVDAAVPWQAFRRDPEWLSGDGVGQARAPWAMLQFALAALRHHQLLRHRPLGVLAYADEGADCRYSRDLIRRAMDKAGQVLVLRPTTREDRLVNQARGLRQYRLQVTAREVSTGPPRERPRLIRRLLDRLDQALDLTDPAEEVAVFVSNLHTVSLPLSPPHRAVALISISYLDPDKALALEAKIRDLFIPNGLGASLNLVSDRPPLWPNSDGQNLVRTLAAAAGGWDVTLKAMSSRWPTVAGLAPAGVAALSSLGPVTRDLCTAREAVQRISLVQRTLLLARFLAGPPRDDHVPKQPPTPGA
jgi:D-alanine-D-alanine ligase